MKLIVPMAGKGTRLRPHTHTTPKALVEVAGRPMLSYVLDSVSDLKFDSVIFIVDTDNAELREFITKNYPFKSVFIQQKEQKGSAHAILGAKKYVGNSDVMILFADTLVEVDLKSVGKMKSDGCVWTKQVDDPRKFGVVFVYNGLISKLIEKPDMPVSDQAIVGLYYFKKPGMLFSELEFLVKHDIKTKGEYHLTDAIQLMISKGSRFESRQVDVWNDCGTISNLLETNMYLLKKKKQKSHEAKNSVIIKPVFIAKGAQVSNSVIGPNVSIGVDAVVESSIITDSIINQGAIVKSTMLKECIIGKHTRVYGASKKLNLGESSEIYYS